MIEQNGYFIYGACRGTDGSEGNRQGISYKDNKKRLKNRTDRRLA
ncbi:MAG TPA: hypothetical protein VJC00_04240 [Candidatus Nanoarchaeia archaeon]|nr:hypothetical protein [Candidatus Nanoarchaeia archaeon]